MIIVVEGPEKAGKTTFINKLDEVLTSYGYQVERRNLGASPDDDSQYSPWLREDSTKLGKIVIWDRGWVSEYVYATMLGRDRRLRNDPWLGEWLHSRAVTPNGLLFMVLPKSPADLITRRDSTDLPVNPVAEYRLFLQHGVNYGWNILEHSYTDLGLDQMVSTAMKKIIMLPDWDAGCLPPNYAGKIHSQDDKGVLFCIGAIETDETSAYKNAWLPGSSPGIIKFARNLGPKAMQCGWVRLGGTTDVMMQDSNLCVPLSYEGIPVI